MGLQIPLKGNYVVHPISMFNRKSVQIGEKKLTVWPNNCKLLVDFIPNQNKVQHVSFVGGLTVPVQLDSNCPLGENLLWLPMAPITSLGDQKREILQNIHCFVNILRLLLRGKYTYTQVSRNEELPEVDVTIIVP